MSTVDPVKCETKTPRTVVIESPYAGTPEQINLHENYARACLKDALGRGEAPFASHLLYTQPGVLDDADPAERDLGIYAGLELGGLCSTRAVYVDLGISAGMVLGIQRSEARAGYQGVVYRTLCQPGTSYANLSEVATYIGKGWAPEPEPQTKTFECWSCGLQMAQVYVELGSCPGCGSDYPRTEAPTCEDCGHELEPHEIGPFGYSCGQCGVSPLEVVERVCTCGAKYAEECVCKGTQGPVYKRSPGACRCGRGYDSDGDGDCAACATEGRHRDHDLRAQGLGQCKDQKEAE